MMNRILLAALSIGAVFCNEQRYQGVNVGKCPHSPGTLASNFSTAFDLNKMLGPWMVVYDEKMVNDTMECSGIRFDLLGDDVLSYSTSCILAEEIQMELLKSGHPQGQLEYYLNLGKALTFTFSDRSVGYLDKLDIEDEVEPSGFNQTHFDLHYLSYIQFLDGDYETHMTLYSC